MDPNFDTAKEFMNQLALEAVEYMKLRKNQVRAMARLRATTITQTLLFPFIEDHTSDIDALYLKDQLGLEWLASVMISVQPDSEKITEAVTLIKKASKDKLSNSTIDELITQLNIYMKEDFNSMRSLKQSIYYRSRSIKAVFTHFDGLPENFKLKRLSNQQTLKDFLNELKDSYFISGKAPKHTQNSYMNEFMSFIYDVAPNIFTPDELSANKSLDNKLSMNLTNFADLASKDAQIELAYRDLMKLLPPINGNSLNSSLINKVNSDSSINSTPALSVSLKKGLGVTFTYSDSQMNEQTLRRIADHLLFAFMETGDSPDLDIQVNSNPKLELVIKCADNAKPDEILKIRHLIEKAFENK